MIRIPDGYVFFERRPGVAAGLLLAADRLKADRKMGVRTITGGYHATVEIAEEYQKTLPVVDGIETIPGTENNPPVEIPGEPIEGESESAEELPASSWTVAEIEAWAARQVPPIEFPSSVTKKADKLSFIQTAQAADNQAEE